jgi:hypothetical protein
VDFYGAAAQVIPVLLLALIFENKALLRQPSSYLPDRVAEATHWNATQIVGRVYLTLVIAAGEFAALLGLFRGETGNLTDAVVWLGLGAALVALLASVLGRQWQYLRQWWSTEARADWWLPAFVLLSLLVVTLTLLQQLA